MSERIYGCADLIRPVPLDRWDLQHIDAADDIIQVRGLQLAAELCVSPGS